MAKARRPKNKNIKNYEEKTLFSSTQGTVGINFEKYDAIPVEINGENFHDVKPIDSFIDLDQCVPLFIRENIKRCKYSNPTPVQKNAIPLAIAGRDLMTCAQTGSGKTFAFLLPCIVYMATCPRRFLPQVGEATKPRCIVLAPTRELASQIHVEAKKLVFDSDIRTVEVYGGADPKTQLRNLASGCDIIVATPGRLIDFVDRGVISLCEVERLVLDEADRMLDMGFEPQIREIVQGRDMPLKEYRQTLLFSATFPSEIQKLATDFLTNYVWIGVGQVGSTTDNITQELILCSEADKKFEMLCKTLEENDGKTLVFVEQKKTASHLFSALRRTIDCFGSVTTIHGDLQQNDRERSLGRFKNGRARILVATDVAARGLDVEGVAHVINFDLPNGTIEDYVHRIGRTGRAGHTGKATSFYVPGDNREGNGNIASGLYKLFKETNQKLPAWFIALPEVVKAIRHIESGDNNKNEANFGGRDMRQKYYNRGGYNNKNHNRYNNHHRNHNNNHQNNHGSGGRGNARGHKNFHNNNYQEKQQQI